MKITYDTEADAIYITFREAPVNKTAQLEPGMMADYAADGAIIGLEILWASQRMEQPRTVEFAEIA
jgi:uncharacterized protein YuzE